MIEDVVAAGVALGVAGEVVGVVEEEEVASEGVAVQVDVEEEAEVEEGAEVEVGTEVDPGLETDLEIEPQCQNHHRRKRRCSEMKVKMMIQ